MVLAALLALLVAHPTSVSSTRVVVDGARVEARIRCDDATLRECLPLDADASGRIDAAELAAGRAAVEQYVLERWRIEDGRGATIPGALARLELVGASDPPKVDLVLRFSAERSLARIAVDSALFREADPFHRDHCEIVWNGAEPAARLLWIEDPRWDFDPRANEHASGWLAAFGAFVRHGIEHILLGFDHVAFVVALLAGARRWRAVLAVVTAFTVAHSITLALAAFEVVTVPAGVVEPAIALSIAWVAARNLWSDGKRAPWIEAFLFGLVHGLGFAGAIGETLASEPHRLAGLSGFNLGVEAGQLAVVAVLLALVALAGRIAGVARGGDGRELTRGLARAASVAVACLGVYWFVERVV